MSRDIAILDGAAARDATARKLFWCETVQSGFQSPVRWWLDSYLPLVDGDPIGGGEPLVALDIVDSIPEVPETLGQVHLQQVSQQILQV